MEHRKESEDCAPDFQASSANGFPGKVYLSIGSHYRGVRKGRKDGLERGSSEPTGNEGQMSAEGLLQD